MAELDLTKAKARAVEEAIGYVGRCVCDEAWTSRKLVDPTCGWHLIEGLAEDIVDASLPHILEALADWAEAEAEGLLMNGVPDWTSADEANRYARAEAAGRWLRARAEEARRG